MSLSAFSQPAAVDLGAGVYSRPPARDGYVTGNGRMYAIGGLGRELERRGKTQLSDRPASRARLAWVTGPSYPVGNLGYGWEPQLWIEGASYSWEGEQIRQPVAGQPFYGVQLRGEGTDLRLTDVMLPGEPVLLRRIVVRRAPAAAPARVRLHFPVFADPRNGVYAMFNGQVVDSAAIARWGRYCGPNLRPRPSVAPERLKQLFPEAEAIVLTGAPRALWQEISTRVPDDSTYARMFPPRALATAVTATHPEVRTGVDEQGLWADLGQLAPGEERTLAVWLVAVSGPEAGLEQLALAELAGWRRRDPEQVLAAGRQQLPSSVVTRTDGRSDPLLRSVDAVATLARACQSRAGGVMAQPYMYPMYYVRDQYGSYRLFLALGEYERALRVLRFYVAMQGRDGIQNAHDAFPDPPDPTVWLPGANALDGYHRRAEVPSYIILMARDYYRATDDIESLRPLYDRLAYNLRVQQFSPNGVLPWATDESYTNTPITHPRYGEEMADSQLLFLGAAAFLADLAERLGHTADAAEFRERYRQAHSALLRRLWLPGKHYLAFARDAGASPDSLDRRPAFDALLRPFWLELSDPRDSLAEGGLQTVLDSLLHPLRVVPEYDWCAGMDPGYLLYALARAQHPATHEAARLLMRYASGDGFYSEYYEYEKGTIRPTGGTMRPWESSINAAAVVQYLLGLRLDLPAGKLYLQPHLPPDWPGWSTKEISLSGEGTLQMTLQRKGRRFTCTLVRRGGRRLLTADLEFGLFGRQLRSRDDRLLPAGPGRLRGTITLPAMEKSTIRLRFRE